LLSLLFGIGVDDDFRGETWTATESWTGIIKLLPNPFTVFKTHGVVRHWAFPLETYLSPFQD